MPKQLPPRPNLEHLRNQAKSLLARLRAGDPAAARAFSRHLTNDPSPRDLRLADAQAVVARQTGFAAWPLLAHHVDRLRALEGTWAFRQLEIDGRPLPAPLLAPSRLLIDGDRFRTETPEAIYEGIFTIDVEPHPHRIDIDFHEGPEAGNRCQGIFELDRDHLRLCLGLAGAPRPSSFSTTPGSGHALELLERVQSARPAQVDGGTKPTSPPTTPATPAPEAPLTATHLQLQGDWLPLEMITSGDPLPPAFLAYGLRTHAGAETKVVFGGQTMLHASISFNEAARPIEVDYLNLAGAAKGLITRGIFRWDAPDQAVFCVAAPGQPRPTTFDSAPATGRIFSRWKKKPA